MREKFIQIITELARKDRKIMLIVADVGYNFVESFQKEFPKQFINVGIAEQFMLGFSAGLSIQGYKPYIYTMKNFILLRPHEQLRNDICYPERNVKLFGVSGSEAYQFLGISHNLAEKEEEKILSTLPNLNIYYSNLEASMTREYHRQGPAYFGI